MTRLSPWLSWSVKPYHLKRLNKQTSCWQPPLLKNRSITLHLCSQTKASQIPLAKPLGLETDPVFSAAANNNILVTCAQRSERSAVTVTKPAISPTFVSRPPETSDPPELPLKTLLHGDPGGTISGYFSRTTSPVPLPRMAFSTRTALPSPTKKPPDLDNTATTPPLLHPPIADKGHFVMLDLWSPDSCVSKQIPFQIDSAASCNTLPSNHLSDMPWATISPSKTVILPYASPPIKPIGQVTLTASKGSSACDLTFQVINTAQPALLSIEASKAFGVLTLNADFIRKFSTSATPPSPMSGTIIHQDSAAGPPPAPPNTSDRIWPELAASTLKFISENCPSLFQGLGFLGPPVDLDPNVRPIHAPTHRQPV